MNYKLNFSWKEFDSKSEFLEEHSRFSVLLGSDNIETPNYFYKIDIPGNASFCIGLMMAGHGIKPALISVENGRRLLLAYDNYITAIDVAEKKIISTLKLDAVFFEFIKYGNEHVVIVHELGVLKINSDLAVLWRYCSPDIIKNFNQIGDTSLQLSFFEDQSVVLISLNDGSSR